jgi:HEAT repeat protein
MAYTNLSTNLNDILGQLGHSDPLTRHQVRRELIGMGENGLAILMEGLRSRNWHVRWESVKALGELDRVHQNPQLLAREMVGLLQDDDRSVRWATMSSLIRLQRSAVCPLLLAMTQDFHSARLREGVHHVLNIFMARNLLTDLEKEVFKALEGSAPSVEAAWADNRALMGGCHCEESQG